MEHSNTGNDIPGNEWLFNEEDPINASPDRTNADTEGFGTDPGERAYFAQGSHLGDPDRDRDEETDDEELADWGNTDPLDQPGDLPDPMDPSGPGSAV